MHERRTAAIEVLRLFAPSLESAGLALVEEWIRAARGWAYVDPEQAAELRASYR